MKLVIFTALGVHPSFWKLILISNILGVISLIPITAQGIGIVELGAVHLFSLLQFDHETTIALYVIARPIAFMLSGIFLGLYIIIAGFPKLRNTGDVPVPGIHEAP
jgi:uncharacterized protein (TIRG00374 family)